MTSTLASEAITYFPVAYLTLRPTLVALRIVADPARFSAVTVNGSDPFTQRTVTILPSTPLSGRIELRVPRAHFADFPRTDLRFERAMSAMQIDAGANRIGTLASAAILADLPQSDLEA